MQAKLTGLYEVHICLTNYFLFLSTEYLHYFCKMFIYVKNRKKKFSIMMEKLNKLNFLRKSGNCTGRKIDI